MKIQRWEYYRDESPDGTFTGVRASPVGQFVTYEDHMKVIGTLKGIRLALSEAGGFQKTIDCIDEVTG